jgi:hypothetical protein
MRNLQWFLIGFLIAISVGLSTAEAEEFGYIEIAQGVKIKDAPWGASNWQGDFPTAVSIGYHWGNRKYYHQFEFSHVSNVLDGAPFNDRTETWLDVVWYKYGLKF